MLLPGLGCQAGVIFIVSDQKSFFNQFTDSPGGETHGFWESDEKGAVMANFKQWVFGEQRLSEDGENTVGLTQVNKTC